MVEITWMPNVAVSFLRACVPKKHDKYLRWFPTYVDQGFKIFLFFNVRKEKENMLNFTEQTAKVKYRQVVYNKTWLRVM